MCCLLAPCGQAEGLFPSAEALFNVTLPSLGSVLIRDADNVQTLGDGSAVYTWYNVTQEDFDRFSAYLLTSGCQLVSSSFENGAFVATLAKGTRNFTFLYDSGEESAAITYPAGSHPEPFVSMREKLDKLRTPGSIVTFGRYEQDADEANGPEPIEWLVLDVQDNQALLLSRYGLDAKPYNTERAAVTWETCTLRGWLNGDFWNKAFTAQEWAAILTTTVDNSASRNGGNDTQDKIFLLSRAEAKVYLDTLNFSNSEDLNIRSMAAPTAWAVKQGAYASDKYRTADNKAAGWWWLRSPGSTQDWAAYVLSDGSLYFLSVNYGDGCVRPAFWLNLDADIF